MLGIITRMEPIIITLLCMPPVLLVVTLVYFWWQRHISPSLVSSYRLSRFTFWLALALGPILVWLFIRQRQPDYFIWSLIGIQWVVGISRGILELRNYRKRLASRHDA
jgi:hypothetical protein